MSNSNTNSVNTNNDTNELDKVKDRTRVTRLQSTTVDVNMGSEEYHHWPANNNNGINSSIYITVEDDENDTMNNNRNTDSDRSIAANANHVSDVLRNREDLHRTTTALSNEQRNYPRLYRLLPTHNITGPVTYPNNSNNTNNRGSPTTYFGRTWRMNLNNVLFLSTSSSTQVLRLLLNNSVNFRYTLPRHNDNRENSRNLQTVIENDNNLEQQQQNGAPIANNPSAINICANNRVVAGALQNSSISIEDENVISTLNPSNTGVSLNGSTRINQYRNNTNSNSNNNTEENNNTTTTAAATATTATTTATITTTTTSTTSTDSSGNFFDSNNNNRNVDPVAFNDMINTEIPEYVLNAITAFVRYLPFIVILLFKFIHDHSLNLFDLLILQYIMYNMNKSLCKQIGKLSQKSFWILSRDLCIIVGTITFRLLIASSKPDPYGLLILPPYKIIMLKLYTYKDKNVHAAAKTIKSDGLFIQHVHVTSATTPQETEIGNSINLMRVMHDHVIIQKAITLDTLIYYIAVNDLILKLLTQLVKLLITMMPKKFLTYKKRARLFASVEYISQFYRALVPMSQWLLYLNNSYTDSGDSEVIAGIAYSSFYIGAKLFELFGRSKPLRKSLKCFFHLTNNERKPTSDELNDAGTTCPICHDPYNAPIVLQCGHIFCDDCVGTWFKREQTCPMCRTKVRDDPTYQDGSTTFFYQLF